MESDRVDVDELRAQIAELEGRVRDLNEFTSLVVHDLDAPARHIEAFADLLERDHTDALSEEGLEYVHYVQSGARRLRQLVLALLDYSRLGAAAIETEPVDVGDLLATVLLDLGDDVSDASIDIQPIPAVLASAPLLGLVLRNLIRNAVQFREPQRPLAITIRGQQVDDDIVVSVGDNGLGIDPQHHEQVFAPLRRMIRVDDAPHARGLGLASVDRIVKAMGGRVWVTSELDVGSDFHVRLPHHPDGS